MDFKLLLTGSILVVGSGFTVQGAEILSDKVSLFEVKPEVCIVQKMGEPCELQTTVQWQTTQSMAVCLVLEQQVLQCWQDEQYISEKRVIVLRQSAEIFLVDQFKDPLAREVLQVNALNPTKQRRRLRSAWSFF